MSNYNSTLQSNNTDLQAILDAVNALPDAGSGGGSVETCTVTITTDSRANMGCRGYGYTALVDGKVTGVCDFADTQVSAPVGTLNNIVCGSYLYLFYYSTYYANSEYCVMSGGVELVGEFAFASSAAAPRMLVFRMPTTAGAVATLELLRS